MRKWMGIIIGMHLLLTSCSINEGEKPVIKEKEQVNMRNELNELLLQAAKQGEVEMIQELVEQGANINAQDAQGRTSAMIATYQNDVATVKVLLELGADVNIQDKMKNSPFLYAGAEGYLDILKLTIAAGADPAITNRFGGTALIPASEHGYIEVIEELLGNTDVDVNHVNNLGWTALMEAIILNNGNKTQQQVVQILIDHGADVNIPDHNYVTPLQHAQQKGFTEIVEILVKAGGK